MKHFLFLILATASAFTTFAQGTVYFNNASWISGWDPVADRNVKFGANPYGIPWGANVSSNYAGHDFSGLRATLFYGIGTYDLFQMTRASGTEGCTFKSSTSPTAGSWFSKTATLDTVAWGTEVNLIVVVWDSKLSAEPRSMHGFWGASAPFQYTPPSGSTPAPAEFLMNNLSSFTIVQVSPEPTSVALAGLGAATLMVFRRRK